MPHGQALIGHAARGPCTIDLPLWPDQPPEFLHHDSEPFMHRLGFSASAISAMVFVFASCAAPPASDESAETGTAATTPAAATEQTPGPPAATVTIDASAKPVLDRLIAQYKPLKGVSVVAMHQIKAPNRILDETARAIWIERPNRFRVDAQGVTLAQCDGNTCTIFNRQTGAMDVVPTPADLPDAIKQVRVLGGGSIAGSGAIVSALLSPEPLKTLLNNVSRVEHTTHRQDDVLVLHLREDRGTVRAGTRVALFIPHSGPAWIAQADVIPKDIVVHTRIAFQDWTPVEPTGPASDQPPSTDP